MGSLQLEPSWEVIQFNMNSKIFALACMAALAGAAPAADADAEADAQFLGYAGHAVAAPLAHAVAPVAVAAPAPNCVTEEVCSTETVAIQEIGYEKVCQEIVDTLCDAPVAAPVVAHYGKREADAEAEADPQYFAHAGLPLAHAVAAPVAVAHAVAPVAPLPVAHAVAHSVTETVKHACREVTTEHCVDNPKIIEVPVEVEHCHTVTKVTCADVENKLPKTTCEAVVTSATSHAAYAAPLPVAHHVAPVGYAYGH